MNVPIVNRQMDLIKMILKEKDVRGEFLEIGCGEGHNLELFSQIGMKGVGIDFSDDAIEIAMQKNITNVQVRKGDLFTLEENNRDIVFLLFVLEHIREDEIALKKILSVLKPGGSLIFSLPAHSQSYGLQDKLAGHYRRYDKPEVIRMLHYAGFEDTVFWSFGFPVSNIYTKLYNMILAASGTGSDIHTDETKKVGIKDYKSHFPWFIRPISRLAFSLLTVLVKSDALFLNTDLGTHYVILAKKPQQAP
jgi:SAM-dependent methyltransferase